VAADEPAAKPPVALPTAAASSLPKS